VHRGWAEGEGEAGSPLSREPNAGLWDPGDHDLSRRQTLNRLTHPGAPPVHSLKTSYEKGLQGTD